MIDLLAPYKRSAEVVVICLGIALGAYWFHQYSMGQQQIGYDRAVAEQTAVEKVRQQGQAKLDAMLGQRVANAEAKADDREQIQKALNVAVGNSADRLQRTVDQIRHGSDTATVEALRTTTATLGTVFQDCTARYRALGQAADGHASDVKTLNDAWPVAPTPAPQQ